MLQWRFAARGFIAGLMAVMTVGAARGEEITLFGKGTSLTERCQIPEKSRTGEYVLTFDVTFGSATPHSFKLYQDFSSSSFKGTRGINTWMLFDRTGACHARSLGSVGSRYTGTPWLCWGYVDYPVKAGETRRVKIVAHGGYVTFYMEFGGVLRRALTNFVADGIRLEALRFDEIGDSACEIRNVRLRPLEKKDLPSAPAGFVVADMPGELQVPVRDGLAAFKYIPGDYPVDARLVFVDGSEKPQELKVGSFGQSFEGGRWDDSGLTFTGAGRTETLRCYSRTRLGDRYTAAQIKDILADPSEYGEVASGHAFDFKLERRGKMWWLWVDGEFLRRIPAEGEITSITIKTPIGGAVKDLARSGAAKKPLGLRLDDLKPFPVARCRENIEATMTVDKYRSRVGLERQPDQYLRRIPSGTYLKARVKCHLAGDEKKSTVLTARITRFLNGTGPAGRPANAWTMVSKELDRSLGTKPQMIDFDFDSGVIQDLIWQLGYEDLDFELLGNYVGHGFIDIKYGKPDEKHPSDVVVDSVALLRAPAGMWVENGTFANVFSAGVTPSLTAHVIAEAAGSYRVSWKIRDIDGKELETYTDDVTLAVGESAAVKREFKSVAPGWYSCETVLSSPKQRLVVRESSYVALAPDTRKATYDSPFFSWTQNDAGVRHDAEKMKEYFNLYAKLLGVHHLTVKQSEEELDEWKISLDPLPFHWIPKDKAGSRESRMKWYEEQVTPILKKNPHARYATVLHESGGGPLPLEIIGEEPKLSEGSKKGAESKVTIARELGAVYRKLAPQIKLILGNTGDSFGIVADLLRGGLEKEYIDYVGEESTGASMPPEINISENFWILREIARHYGYDKVGNSACFEFKSRPLRLFDNCRQLAAFERRDTLTTLAWGSPVAPMSSSPEPNYCYYHTSWGTGAFSRTPLLQPYPNAASVATITRVLDSATFSKMIPTGSKSAYCLEFVRKGGGYVYAFWTRRTEQSALVVSDAASAVHTRLYGEERTLGPKNGAYLFRIGYEPSYLTLDRPITSVRLGKDRTYPNDVYPGSDRAKEVVRIKDADQLKPVAAPGGLNAALGHFPLNVPGKLTAATVKDDEKGSVVEVTLDTTEPKKSPLFKEYGFFELKQPAAIPADCRTLAIEMKGNSCGGRIYLTVEDAVGRRYVTAGRAGDGYYDAPGKMVIDFDGWNRVSFPLIEGSPVTNWSRFEHRLQWRGYAGSGSDLPVAPVKVVGFGFALRRQTLNLVEFEPSSSMSVSVSGFYAY